ncbi:fumarylacetoacetate hydrolase family protein [Rehaibacterium terrae]|uniref:Fumarylpyruvate hydrolase n=1 Tax=Rehaibacterium terrae TaxID=1341696 RepID=A0A7W7XZ16_9GAMM|nr:fumarylacetoacetate hydrolase family protein [Rehaibacterium terrae]MBB5015055.1 fumarylpyruvate hydrolase [Rehaibacterium terrae]
MSRYLFPAPAIPSLAVRGTAARFPVHRIYCVGRNFAEHAKEMGASVERGTPTFFMKPADAVVPGGGDMPFPRGTADLHHEVELVVALGRDADGEVPLASALDLVFGYGVGLDLTRRDLQAIAKDKRLPWDTAKGFDRSAPVSEIVPATEAGAIAQRRLWLEVNGELRQQATLDRMVFGVAEVIQALSTLYDLKAGDLVFMGTPAGVAALRPGDRFRAGIDGLVEFAGGFAA